MVGTAAFPEAAGGAPAPDPSLPDPHLPHQDLQTASLQTPSDDRRRETAASGVPVPKHSKKSLPVTGYSWALSGHLPSTKDTAGDTATPVSKDKSGFLNMIHEE